MSGPRAEDEDDLLRAPADDEPPPFLRTWARVYAAVLIYLAVLITAFYLFSRSLSA
ncbi:MAG TPA: hypothetical protein VLT57_18950 [Bryobacteraceae bacterium]|jgi:hypothetical protein|nr:hypothetical protein [Bryobacteraceae bacterium]